MLELETPLELSVDPSNSAEEVEPPRKKRRGEDVICELCKTETSKYTCPQCRFRSCSVECVRLHKKERDCSGEAQHQVPRLAWNPVPKLSEFSADHSIDDQHFLSGLKESLHTHDSKSLLSSMQSDEFMKPSTEQIQLAGESTNEDKSNFSASTTSIIRNARQRRVWLKVKKNEDLGKTSHESYSDTIFWTVRLRFVQSTTADGKPNTMMIPVGRDSEQKTNSLLDLSMYNSSDDSTVNEQSPTKIVNKADVEDGELSEETDEKTTETAEIGPTVVEKKVDVTEDGELDENESAVEAVEGDEDLIQVATQPAEKSTSNLRDLYVHEVNGIPETLRVRTLLRQFIRPRDFGPLVSRADLDTTALAPFIAAPDSVLVYMAVEVENGQIKYYVVDNESTLLGNLQNRVVYGYPELIVALNNDLFDFEQPTMEELEKLKIDNQGNERPFHHNRRGRGGHYNGNQRSFNRRGGSSRSDQYRPYRQDFYRNQPPNSFRHQQFQTYRQNYNQQPSGQFPYRRY
ncbi:Zinc finger, HIT-type domain-containing protein [Aphelenchoides besseyi]|nr:Zinc finger, HIT-type domain-containing protein [Aphelenchoides besseyi]KAI6231688.1 Zinc finger, HIT-type domain-containing protein [Aphelenchoides besseyi]